MPPDPQPPSAKIPFSGVRPFAPGDREALLQIGADTAFFGAPIETYLDDRRIFMDGFYAYYTHFEPHHAWVAVQEDQVVGFLTGCVDTQAYKRVLLRKIIPRLLLRVALLRYRMGRKTWVYVARMARAYLWPGSQEPDLSGYPAHLHINVLPQARGQGLGGQLISAYLQQLAALKIGGVHLHTTSYNRPACHLYERMGFSIIHAHPITAWKQWIAEPVEARTYARRIQN